jgi:outer membrane protein insertion porin family
MGSLLGGLSRIAVAAALALGLTMVVAATSTSTHAQSAETIVVQGNRRVDAETIRSYFQLRPGERLDAVKIDEALKALYATGLYEDVRINQQGGRLIVTVVENLTINRVAFEGNKKVKDEVLNGEIQSRQRGPLSRSVVQADVQRIVEVYRRQGMLNVRVDPKLIDQPNGRADLVFEINEGDKTTVKRISFVGNNKFSDAKLRDVITTQQSHWFSFLNNRDLYDSDRVSADQELLRRHYLKNGYADFRILSATVDLDSGAGGFVLTFTVEEGEQYKFGSVDLISNLRDVSPDELSKILRTKSGSPYNAEHVEKSIEQITIELSKRGYAFAQVRPRGDRDVVTHVINLTFIVEEGARVYVERINIRGNTRTRDNVVRREFELLEGDPYNRVLVDRAERRLKNLGYFKSVKITNEPGSAGDRVILNVDVEEQMTGEFSIGGGYSTYDGAIAEISLAERNFLGRGHYVRVAGAYGQRVRSAEFSFTEPYFLGTRVAAGFDVFTKTSLRSTFNPVDMTNVGTNLRLGLPLREDLTLGLRYSIYQRKVSIDGAFTDGCRTDIDGNVVPPNCNTDPDYLGPGLGAGDAREVSLAYQDLISRGKYITSSIGYSLIHNSLDDMKNPKEGSFVNFAQDFAGVGGDVKFFKTSFDNRNYFPVTDDVTGMVRFQGGYITGWGGHELMLLDHFFQGPNLVRGFAPAGIGPRDGGLNSRDALGASMYWGASAELVFPFPHLPKDFGLKGAVFADVGSAWGYKGPTTVNSTPLTIVGDSNKIRSSVGLSLLWESPMGPLRFDYAFVLSKDNADREQAFRFGMGNKF